MRNAALLAGLVLLIAGAAAGVTDAPAIAIVAIILAAVLGNAVVTPARRRAHQASGQAASARTGITSDVAYNDTLRSTEQENRRELDDGLGMICDVLGARAAVLWRTDPSNDAIRAVAAHGRALPPMLALRGDPLAWIAREGTPMRINPLPQWAPPDARVNGMRLWEREDRGWLLTVELPADDDLDPAALATVAAPLRLLVELQNRRYETDAEGRRLRNLLGILHRIPVATELEEAGDVLVSACVELTGGTGGAVGVWDGDTGRIVSVVGTDGGPQKDAVFQSPTSELALAVRAEGPLVREVGKWKPGLTQIANEDDRWDTRIRTFAAIPLPTSHGITSVLALWSTRDQPLDPAGLELVTAIAPYAALHLKHAREFGRMRETAATDALTGLKNRRAFDEALQHETVRYERYERPLSLLMIDMDHFKSINDKYGHEGGDEVLRRVAAIVKSCVRELDTAARFGGEELAVLLPETPVAYAREVAERIRTLIEKSPIDWNGRRIRVTVSVGVSAVPERVATPDVLLASADEALYEAKKKGRNRVIG